MSDDDDNRVLCKYGASCYQKNPAHHKKYKHISKKRISDKTPENESKKVKLDDESFSEDDGPKRGDSHAELLPDSGQGRAVETEISCQDSGEIIERINVNLLPDDVNGKIGELFLVKMPDDFYGFFEFCKTLSPKTPKHALRCLGLELVGPFDVLQGTIKNCTREEALIHYRYYYDPPEFQTVLKGDDKTGLHYGYFRDDPNDLPVFVASNEANKGCEIHIKAGNLFGALSNHIERVGKTADPFRKMQIQKISTALNSLCKNNKISMDTITPETRARRSKVVTKTFHGAGLVVPYDDKQELGYRELAASNKELKEILNNLCSAKSEIERKAFWGKLQPVITFANIANDECDFGTSLELGIDLFCFGNELLHKVALQLLTDSYTLLKREQFAKIITAHLKNRSKGCDLNFISS